MALTADWNPLGDVYFRKFDLYSMQWTSEADLQKYLVSAAPYGGPIALLRDETKLPRSGLTPKATIHIYNAAGKDLSIIKWNSGTVLKLGWSNTEELLCIQDDGSVLIYDIFGFYKRTFSMGQEAKDVKIIQCQIFQTMSGKTGIAVLTSSYRIFLVSNIEDPRVRRLAEIPGIDAPPSCWTIISNSSLSHALVAKENQIYVLDQSGTCELQTFTINGPIGAYVEMAVSVNNKNLALFTSTGLLWIGSSDLQRVHCEFDTKCLSRPHQLVWCGTSAVVGYWESLLLMVGPMKDWIKYSYESPVHCVPEIDGLRIISNTTHELLYRIPAPIEEIYRIGSMKPGAVLLDAFKEYKNKSVKADEYVRVLGDKMADGVAQCISAASHEFDEDNQKLLLRAASFGKSFLTNHNPDEFVRICKTLRVLFCVRSAHVGIPLTYAQLEHLEVSVLIDRLIARRLYGEAMDICKCLALPEVSGSSRVLAHWACFKVQQTHLDDDQIARDINVKLGMTPGVSYSEIANKAFECGKTDLAIRLLNFETRASEQVPMLMKMKKDNLALTKAIESGDTDLVYTVLLQLKERMQLGEFLMSIRTVPVAYSLYLQYCLAENKKLLLDLYYQEDNHQGEARCRITNYYEEERLDARLNMLVETQDAFLKSKNECATKLSEEQLKLMRYQRRLEEELNQPFVDLSLHETMHRLMSENNIKLVEQMRKEFKVPDRRYWWLRIGVLAEKGDWIELDRFSKSKKSPIGYEPFIEVCLKNDNANEAKKYLNRVAPENLSKCHIKLGQLDLAAEAAFQNKNTDDLNAVSGLCGANKVLYERVNNMKLQLTSKPN